MKIDVSMQSPIRFEPDDNTKLHFHTDHVSPRKPLVVKSGVGPSLFLRKDSILSDFPQSDAATPYGFGRSEMTGFIFNEDQVEDTNYLTTASSDSPSLDDQILAVDKFRMSLFFKPVMESTEFADDIPVLIAGVPGCIGLYQYGEKLRLGVETTLGPVWCEMHGGVDQNAWHLVEVQWVAGQRPTWFVNGKNHTNNSADEFDDIDKSAMDRFNLAYDPLIMDGVGDPLYWRGVIREVELSSNARSIDADNLESEMNYRAMTLFGLCTDTSPVPDFRRGSCAWVMANGELHKLSYNHPRNTELGVLVEEERANLIEISAPAMTNSGTTPDHWWHWNDLGDDELEYWETPETGVNSPLPAGRYTLWFDQQNEEGCNPIVLELKQNTVYGDLDSTPGVEIHEDEAYVLTLSEPTFIRIVVEIDNIALSKLIHVQLEKGADDGPAAVGKTSHIVSLGTEAELPIIRKLETLYYEVNGADLVDEQGRLDIKITPQHTGPRAILDDVAVAGDVFSMSLVRDEILSTDGSGDQASFGTKGLWTEGETRQFHVEWQPGTRLIMEDSLGLVAAADYCGTWRTPELLALDPGQTRIKLYIGGGPDGSEEPESGSDTGVRANSFIKQLIVDDWVPRYHADLHRFMYRQFGEGGFSRDEASYFRKWRRTEGDALALMARLGDRLKNEAFADTTDTMLREWEQSLGLPSLWALSDDERREVVTNLFKALGAHDAEIEEAVTYLTDSLNDFAVVIERHLGDVTWDETKMWDVWEMYEYYVQVPALFYNESYLELIRWLMERQEPAHTVGYPIVRTEFHTNSNRYGNVVHGQGTEDTHLFDDVGALTERDCVGLASWNGEYPKGIWLPTDIKETDNVDDLWDDTTAGLPKPSILIPCNETSTKEDLKETISTSAPGLQILLEPNTAAANIQYQVPCTGLLVADRDKDIDSSNVSMNLGRGVEIKDDSHHFSCYDDPRTDTAQLKLDEYTSAAFMHLFRVTDLPASGSKRLFEVDNATSQYRLSIDLNGDLIVTVGAITPTFALGLKEGEWACVLMVLDRTANKVRVYTKDGLLGVTGSDSIDSNWTMGTTNVTFYLGGAAADSSALTHHAYWAAWLGHQATGFDETLVQKFFQALNGPFSLDNQFLDNLGDPFSTQVCWPVGTAPAEDLDVGELACKYNNDQFPFADLGDRYDVSGEIQRVRGLGVNRDLTNEVKYSESFHSDEWSGGTADTEWVQSPSGLTSAKQIDDIAHDAAFYTNISSTGASYLGVSCWAKKADGDDIPAELYCDSSSAVTPNSFLLTDKWQRLAVVFELTGSPEDVDVGIKQTSNATKSLQLWGFQAVIEPVIGPYIPSTEDTTTTAPFSKVVFDENDFTGFNRRGFINLRVKFEELVDKLGDTNRLILADAFEKLPGDSFDHATLTLENWKGDPNEQTQELQFQLRFLMQDGDTWEDDVTWVVNADQTADLDVAAAWTDPEMEHQIAIAWDITRPVARTNRHIAMWIDGELATRRAADNTFSNYAENAPEDAMDMELKLSKLSLGTTRYVCEGVTAAGIDGDLIQPCAVFREIEVYTRHHPGIFTPTRLQVREAEEAE
ncbi:MAG: DUF2313 domain-containing protein [Deltaproteobacteria bacterium]|nr:DUF2313 domain-containing protein [Deltaproteobacteria bacterium]